MPDVVENLESQEDASTSSDDRFADDKSVDTSVEATEDVVEVETDTAEDVEEPESEDDSSPSEEEDLEEKTDTPDGTDEEFSGRVKARIDELTRKRRDTERLVDVKDAEIADLRKQIEAMPQPEAEPLKTLADFEYDEGKYQAYMLDENSRRTAETVRRVLAESQQAEFEDQLNVKFEARVKEFAKSVKDYDEVTGDRGLPINQPMARVIKAYENGPEIAYYLGKHPDETRQISQMPAELAGYELSKISTTLQADRVKATPKKVTKAPPPPPKIKSGDEGLQRGFHEGMSDAEFAKLRRKQIARR